MATTIQNYRVVDPPTSQLLRDQLFEAVTEGKLSIDLRVEDIDTGEEISVSFEVVRSTPQTLAIIYLGKIHGGGLMTITATTHPVGSDEPAGARLVRRTP